MRRLITCFSLLLLSYPAASQVYKCTGENGTPVYSQRPCSNDPGEVTTVDVSRSLKTSGGLVTAPTTVELKAQQIGRQTVCDRREREIRSRFAADLLQADQLPPRKAAAAKDKLTRGEVEELKEAAKLCEKEMALP